jgi:transposase
MRAYSQDLRDRIVADVASGECTQNEAAQKYAVSLSCVQKLRRRVRETGSSAAKPPSGGAKRKLAAAEAQIRSVLKDRPDIRLTDLCEQIEAQLGIKSDPSLMSRELKRLGITLKKRSSMPASARRGG